MTLSSLGLTLAEHVHLKELLNGALEVHTQIDLPDLDSLER